MSPKKILLRGYYGWKNFGDDLLLIVSYRLLKKFYPAAKIDVMVHNNKHQYINDLLGDEVQFIKSGENHTYDLIVHGGGGVHFDFIKGPYKYALINKGIRLLGYRNFIKTETFVRRLLNKPSVTSKQRWGWGIGVGTFTPSSQKFHQNISILADYDKLFIRDQESKQNLKTLGIKTEVEVLTDIVFLKELWFPSLETKPKDKNAIGFVLRDWAYQDVNYLDKMLEVAQRLQDQGYKVSCFSLDEHTDQQFINKFKIFPMYIWKPEEMSLKTYMQLIADQYLLVSSRAHGAISGACAGVPSICLEIEPKLRNVHQMLSTSSSLLNPFDETVDEISKSITEKLQTLNDAAVENDVRHNRVILDKLYNMR